MRSYLMDFFKEFEYEEKDAEQLLCAYEKVVASESANEILCGILAAYERSVALDYQAVILNRIDEIAEKAEVHSYTVGLLVFLCMTKHLRTVYSERGLDEKIYRDTVLDLKWKLEECKLVKGICGTFVAYWFPGFFKLERFTLGRLQFEIITAKQDYEWNGMKFEKGKSRAINVHIPRTGTPMDRESCDESYRQARAFFADQVGEHCPFICHSWLLFPENKDILPAHTNTYRFLSEYIIIDWGYNNGEDLWRLFDTEERDPEKLPANGSLRRCYVEHLKRGGRVGWGLGIKF